MGAIKHAEIQAYGEVLAASIGSSYSTVVTGVGLADIMIAAIFNNCNQPIIISLDNGVTDHFKLSSESFVLDFQTSYLRLKAPAVIQVKHAGVAPTTGSIRVTVIR